MKKIITIIAIAASLSACNVIDTGKVGLRKKFDNTIESTELVAGSFNQTIIGSVIEIPIKEISVDVNDLNPIAADNSTMSDFDATIIYSINPASVSDLYVNKNRSFHSLNEHNEILLMHSYLQTTVKNAVYKVARKYEAMKMNDERQAIEAEILTTVKATLASEKLDTAILVSQVQVKSMKPSAAITQAANDLVKAKSEQLAKEVEVKTAKLEADRMAMLANNAGQSIAYMNAQATLKIAEGVASGKVNTIVIPMDFKGIVNTK